jgi:APA family basic amino acid/polyamine antiporter
VTAPQGPRLERRLGLFETTVGGVGIILGAGIYALVGEVAGRAADATWLSFVLAAVMAAAIGLGYAELASAFPTAAADYEYSRQGLGDRPAFVVGWLIVIGNLVAAAAVALGFGAYLTTFVDVDPTLVAIAALAVATTIAFLGIREALWTSILFTAIEVAGLVFIIAIGLPHLGDEELLRFEKGAGGVFSGTALVAFAFIGFTEIATLSEETQQASRVVPRAMLIAIGVTTAIYVLVAVSALSVLGWQDLSESEAPLAAVAAEVLGDRAESAIATVALFSTANTVLLMLVAASRLVYGMASQRALPRFLAWIHPRAHTPARAIGACLVVSAGFALTGDLELVAGASNFAVFVAFAAVSLSLIALRYRRPEVPRPFRVPVSIGRLPLIPVFAIGSVAFMMTNLGREPLLVGGALLVSGLLAMEALALWRPGEAPPPDETADA